ncbi:MAG: hypothetical protein JWM12_4235, partial [Ilumatobacteraceae bacterium]|nr:hypothetical protein [Ilumatobacteraceae bacterium]
QGQNVPNAVIARLGGVGAVCLFTYAATDLIVDVAGYLTGPPPDGSLQTCPADPTPPPPPPPPPATPVVISAGTYVVGQTIQTGRYIAADARNGCYWERTSGFGGTVNEINANDFQSFTGRMIVDILASDVGFDFTAACGKFRTYTPTGPAVGFMGPGSWVVGADIVPGTYTTSAAANCYWERRTSFAGDTRSIVANDFLPTAQSVVVTIRPSDTGFYATGNCGNWALA